MTAWGSSKSQEADGQGVPRALVVRARETPCAPFIAVAVGRLITLFFKPSMIEGIARNVSTCRLVVEMSEAYAHPEHLLRHPRRPAHAPVHYQALFFVAAITVRT
ncbi:MAG: hypothetical protein IPG68_14705 [Micrococcales bacterium]|nr:hypothetical protein [Micrococcales bacterium]